MNTAHNRHTTSRTTATALAVSTVAVLILSSLAPASAGPPYPPHPGACSASTMQFVAAYERDPAWGSTYHTMIKNLHWVTQSISLGPVTVLPDPKLNWGNGSYSMWWLPYFEPIAKLNGTNFSSVIPTTPWYMECSGNTAYSVKSTAVVFDDGGIRYILKIYNTTIAAEYPEYYDTQYKIRWNLCYDLKSVASMADTMPPLIFPMWEYLSDTIDELIRSDTYDGPFERTKKEASDDAEALDRSVRALAESLYEESLPPEAEGLRWEVIERLERIAIELEGARNALQLGGDAGDDGGSVEYFIVARAHVQIAAEVMNEVEELLTELSRTRD